MSDNVLILGAGFSADAGIPLLSGFVDAMLQAAMRKTVRDEALTSAQLDILNRALTVRAELDGYHGRAMFDDRNIEDLLSILAFNVLGGGKAEGKKLDAMTRAIACTIDLTCMVKHPGLPRGRENYTAISGPPEKYRAFWRLLFEWVRKGNALPTIITFNYDLVLERALFQLLINTVYDGYKERLPFNAIRFSYGHEQIPDQLYDLSYVSYGHGAKRGTIIKPATIEGVKDAIAIKVLKLHGSVNFPRNKAPLADFSLTNSLEDPQILPPVSNKLSGNTAQHVWRAALNELREAKNVVFLGYSLPRTDIYMQYFLKAALGPNKSLNRIFVFDPLLTRGGPVGDDMRARYEECFAQQLRQRLCFRPDTLFPVPPPQSGTLEHFIHILGNQPGSVFF